MWGSFLVGKRRGTKETGRLSQATGVREGERGQWWISLHVPPV